MRPTVPTREALLHEVLRVESAATDTGDIPPQLLRLLELYQTTQDINALAAIRKLWPDYRLLRVVDRNTRRGFLVIFDGPRLLPVVSSLAFAPSKRGTMRVTIPPSADAIQAFADSSAVFLFLEGGRDEG